MAVEDIKNIPVVEASMSNATYVGAGGSMGPQGPQGETGPKGDPFTYEDFTEEQLEGLRGPQGPQGPKGDPFTYSDFTQEQLEALRGPQGEPFTFADLTPAQIQVLKGPKGDTGNQGPQGVQGETGPQGPQGPQGIQGIQGETGSQGPQGNDGNDGFSPTASISKQGNTATITITDKNGTTTATITDGAAGTNGTNGQDGNDGITPTVSVSTITGGHNVDFNYGIDDYRNTNFDVMDGQDGQDGNTPVITTSKSGTTTTIYADGVSIGTISDGAPGQDGSAGQNGNDGQDGNDGKSAYEIAVDNGFSGNEAAWLASLVGPAGQNGQDGDDGIYVGSSAPTDPDVNVWIDTSGSTPNIANYYTKTEVDNKGYLTQLPTASISTLGGVKVDGTTIIIDNNGVISGSGGSSLPTDPVNNGTYILVNTISSGTATQTWESVAIGGSY